MKAKCLLCSVLSLENDRVLVDPSQPPDAEGFQEYRIRSPKPIRYIIVGFPFIIQTPDGDVWASQSNGGVITWNGEVGEKCSMRIIKMEAFKQTYKLLD